MNSEQEIMCGAAEVDVTPRRLNGVWLAGYKPNRRAREIDEGGICIRALALGEPGAGLLIVIADTCLISGAQAAAWARAIARHVPLPPERILIITSHTHSGPDVCFLFGGVPPDYYLQFRRGVIRAARDAWAARAHAAMFAGTSSHTLGIPRRHARGQQDTENQVVVLQWRRGKETAATLMNIGCHGVVYPRQSELLSADLPGALCRAAAAECGGAALFAPRAQGDVNPDLPGKNAYEQDGNTEELNRLTQIGLQSIMAAVQSAVPVPAAPLDVKPFEISVLPRSVFGLLATGLLMSGRIAPPTRIPARMVRIGGIAGPAAPVETLTCLGRAWLDQLPQPSLVLSYCGGYFGYLMTRETFKQRGYETMVSAGPVADTSLPVI